MIIYDFLKNDNEVFIPRHKSTKIKKGKSCFLDENRISSMPVKSNSPLFEKDNEMTDEQIVEELLKVIGDIDARVNTTNALKSELSWNELLDKGIELLKTLRQKDEAK